MTGQGADHNRRWRAEDHPAWQARPGRRSGPKVEIEDLLTDGYRAHEWMRQNFRGREPYTKGRFCKRMNLSRPSANKYLAGAGLSFPFPSPESLIWVTDVDDSCLRWVNPMLCTALQREASELVGHDAREVLRANKPSELGHFEAIKALVDGTSPTPYHECETTFLRADGCWIRLTIRVSYGPLYRTWLGVGTPIGDPIPPASANAEQKLNLTPTLTYNPQNGQLVLEAATSLQLPQGQQLRFAPAPIQIKVSPAADYVVHTPQNEPVPQSMTDELL